MIYYYFFSFISILVATQNRLLFWPALPVIFAACFQDSSSPVLILSFTTGLLLDLFVGNPLGISAIILILATGLVLQLKSRFGDNWRIFILVLILTQIVFYVSNH